MDTLIAEGHGGETLFQVLGYLKNQSNGIISDEFYNQVAAAPTGSEVFTATLGNYAGLEYAIEIAADGTAYIPYVTGINYISAPGFTTAPSQDGAFQFTYAQDAGHYIFTHSKNYGGGVIKDYYAFTIAWSERKPVYMPVVMK